MRLDSQDGQLGDGTLVLWRLLRRWVVVRARYQGGASGRCSGGVE